MSDAELSRSSGEASTSPRTPQPAVIAHRGFAGVYPENTLCAVRAALDPPDAGHRGADAIEIDVMATSDGELVVFHDRDLARVTAATNDSDHRPIWELTYEELRHVDLFGSGETVPTLSAVLDVVPAAVPINVELKNPGAATVRPGEPLDRRGRGAAFDRWLPFVERVVDCTDAFDHDFLVSSFCEGALAAMREVAPDVSIASVFWDSIERGLTVTHRYDCEVLHLPRNMVAGTSLFNDDYVAPSPFESVDLVTLAHEEGRLVNVWTVDTWWQAAELERAGVDGLIADYPGLLGRLDTD